jgi:TonB family protein
MCALMLFFRPHYKVPARMHRMPIQLVSLSAPGSAQVKRETSPRPRVEQPLSKSTPPVPIKGKAKVEVRKDLPKETTGRPSNRPKTDIPKPKVGSADSSQVLRSNLPAVGDFRGSMQLRVEGEPLAYSYYLEIVQRKIASSWVPPAGLDPRSAEVSTQVWFRIERDGNVQNRYVEEPSGSTYFDTSALRALDQAVPLPPLPAEYPGDYLIMHLRFVYSG